MTALLVDKWKDKLYLFADGRLTQGDLIVSNTFTDKIVRSGEFYYIMCGAVGAAYSHIINLIDGRSYKELQMLAFAQKSDFEHPGEYTILIVDSSRKEICYFTKFNDNSVEVLPCNISNLPISEGSGAVAVKASYLTLLLSKSPKTEKQYLNHVHTAFEVTKELSSSCGSLVSKISIDWKA